MTDLRLPARIRIRSLAAIAVLVATMFIASCEQYTRTTVGTKSAGNETAAIGALRTIASAQTAYSVTHEGEYGSFAELVTAGNLDVRFGGDRPVIGGYVFSMKVTTKGSGMAAGSYTVNADPQQDVAAGSTGGRHFFMGSTDSAIRVNQKQAASLSDPQL